MSNTQKNNQNNQFESLIKWAENHTVALSVGAVAATLTLMNPAGVLAKLALFSATGFFVAESNNDAVIYKDAHEVYKFANETMHYFGEMSKIENWDLTIPGFGFGAG